MNIDQRKRIRYAHGLLTLNVARPGITGFLKLAPTSNCMNFSLSGIQFGTNQPFRHDEKLILDLVIGDIELYELNARVVIYGPEQQAPFCTRVEFDFATRRMQKPEVMHALLQIEDRLRLASEYPQ